MKKTSKMLSLVLSLLLVLSMTFSANTFVLAAGEDALLSLGFADTLVLDFAPETTTYTVYVPWDETNKSYVNPALTYTATEGADVLVSGGLEDGAYTVTVGGTIYTINLIKIGENKFYNGDFEGNATQNEGSLKPATPDGERTYEGSDYTFTRIPEGWTNGLATNTQPTLDRTTHGDPAGEYCVRTRVQNYAMALRPDSEHSVNLSNGLKYLYREMRRDSGLEIGGSQVDENKYPNNVQFDWYKADGSIGTAPTLAPAAWETNHAVVTPSADISGFYSSVRGTGIIDMLFDNMFIGELVVSKISVTDTAGNSSMDVIMNSESTAETITLSAVKFNQLGNQAGLGTGATSATWSVEGAPQGITVENGVVTVAPETPAGSYRVEAVAETGLSTQTKVKGVYTVNVIAADAEVGALSSLAVSSVEAQDFGFSYDKYSYSIQVPVQRINGEVACNLPKVTAVCKDEADTCTVTYPEAVNADGSSYIEVVVFANGEPAQRYKIYLEPVGVNLFPNPGFEEGLSLNPNVGNGVEQPVGWHAKNGGLTLSNENAAEGSSSVVVGCAAYNGLTLRENLPLDAETVYLYSSMYRKRKDTDTNLAFGIWESMTYANGEEGSYELHYYNAGGTEVPEGWTLGDAWQSLYATVSVTKPVSRFNWQYLASDVGILRYMCDEMFLGELVIGDIAFNTPDGITFATKNEEQTVALSAKVYNQIGTSAGLKNKYSMAYSILGAPEGVTIANGELTIPAGFAGTITVQAKAKPGWENPCQDYYMETIDIEVVDTLISYEKAENGEVTATLNYKAEEDDAFFFVTAVYSKNENGTEKLESLDLTPVDYTANTYESKTNTVTPAIGQSVRSFVLRSSSLKPLMEIVPFTE